jgi:glycosyltransferase involved in cell wall biosynthesis
MYRNHRVTIYLPCRNEAKHLPEIIARLPKFADEVIVVSNKSTDNTIAVAQSLGVKAISDDRTKGGIGYGYAHLSGLAAATGDIIATADGDGTYPIEQLDKVIDYLLDQNLDFVSCNRYPLQDGTKIPFKLQLGVNILNWETRLLYGFNVKDILSGMWVMRREVKDKLELTEGDWNMSPQIKINAATNPEIKFAEYSIAQHQRLGETKQQHWKTGFQHLWWILKNRVGL